MAIQIKENDVTVKYVDKIGKGQLAAECSIDASSGGVSKIYCVSGGVSVKSLQAQERAVKAVCEVTTRVIYADGAGAVASADYVTEITESIAAEGAVADMSVSCTASISDVQSEVAGSSIKVQTVIDLEFEGECEYTASLVDEVQGAVTRTHQISLINFKGGGSDSFTVSEEYEAGCAIGKILSYGAEVIDEEGKVAIDSEATRQCLEMVAEMVEKRYINDSTVATTGSYDNGKSAMLFQSASVSLYAERLALKGKVDLVSFPLITVNNTPKIGAGIAGYAINAASENKEIAWAFLTYLLSYEGQQKMALNGLNLASIRQDLADYKTANWGKGYETLNLSAYPYGSEYKISTDFFVRTTLSAKAGLQQALQQMFNSASNAEKAKDIDSIIATTVRDMEDAMIEY